jgi:hypothetical protein
MTQAQRILERLNTALGDGWVNGRIFLRDMYISQFHARIKELERKGYEIEHSTTTDDYGFKSYRLAPKQDKLL